MDRLHPNTHPDFLGLVDRYEKDIRFKGRDDDRQKCINNLLALNNWVQLIVKPPEIMAVLLAGSFSALKEETPDLAPVIDGPRYWGKREGGSDMDVLFFYRTSVAGLLKLKWLDFNLPERELVHPGNFLMNTIKDFRGQLVKKSPAELAARVEVHVVGLTPALGKFALKMYVKNMIRTGTLMWGNLTIDDYGKRRDNPPTFKRNARDGVIDQMGGGF